MSNAVITRQTSEALDRVMAFFGIDAYNRPLFGEAARMAGVDAFSKVIEALDGVLATDSRNGSPLRIRDRIERQKVVDRNRLAKEKQCRSA